MEGEAVTVCRGLLQDLLERAGLTGRAVTVRPVFQRKRPAAGTGEAGGAAKMRREGRAEAELEHVSRNLMWVSGERDQFRQQAELARQQAERLAVENNQLVMANAELMETVEQQGSACTALAASLGEVIWTVTGGTELVESQVSEFCRTARLCLSQQKEAGPVCLELCCALLGSLVNLTSKAGCLGRVLGCEEGRHVAESVAGLVQHCTHQPSLLLAFMLLDNLFRAELKFNEVGWPGSSGVASRVAGPAASWSQSERARPRLRQVAARLAKLLQIKEKEILFPEQ